jgi:hypothetical protein
MFIAAWCVIYPNVLNQLKRSTTYGYPNHDTLLSEAREEGHGINKPWTHLGELSPVSEANHKVEPLCSFTSVMFQMRNRKSRAAKGEGQWRDRKKEVSVLLEVQHGKFCVDKTAMHLL